MLQLKWVEEERKAEELDDLNGVGIRLNNKAICIPITFPFVLFSCVLTYGFVCYISCLGIIVLDCSGFLVSVLELLRVRFGFYPSTSKIPLS